MSKNEYSVLTNLFTFSSLFFPPISRSAIQISPSKPCVDRLQFCQEYATNKYFVFNCAFHPFSSIWRQTFCFIRPKNPKSCSRIHIAFQSLGLGSILLPSHLEFRETKRLLRYFAWVFVWEVCGAFGEASSIRSRAESIPPA